MFNAALRPIALVVRLVRRTGGSRLGRPALFAMVGGIGTVLNLLIMGILLALGVHYVAASLVAAELTILSNFFMQEKLVFAEERHTARTLRHRFVASVGFNNIEALLRMPLLMLLVEVLGFNSLVAQAGALACAFVVRYLFHAKVVYRHRPADPQAPEPVAAAAAAAIVLADLRAPEEPAVGNASSPHPTGSGHPAVPRPVPLLERVVRTAKT